MPYDDFDFDFGPARGMGSPGDPFYIPNRQSSNPFDSGGGGRSPFSFGVPEYDYGPLNRYHEYLGSMPSRDSVKSNIWDKIGAGLSGAAESYFRGPSAGIKLIREMMDEPYERALNDWKTKGVGVQAAVEKENTSYDRALKRSKEIGDREREDRQAKLTERNIESQIDRRLAQTENDDERIKIAKEQAKNAGGRVIEDSDGMAVMVFPDGRKVNFGFKTNALTEQDRKELASYQSGLNIGETTKRLDQQHEKNKEMEDIRQKGRVNLEEKRQDGRPEQTHSPAALKTARNNAAQKVFAENPQEVMKYFTQGPNGKMTPNMSAIQSDAEGYRKFRSRIEELAMDELNVSKSIRSVGRPKPRTPSVSAPGSKKDDDPLALGFGR